MLGSETYIHGNIFSSLRWKTLFIFGISNFLSPFSVLTKLKSEFSMYTKKELTHDLQPGRISTAIDEFWNTLLILGISLLWLFFY